MPEILGRVYFGSLGFSTSRFPSNVLAVPIIKIFWGEGWGLSPLQSVLGKASESVLTLSVSLSVCLSTEPADGGEHHDHAG